MNLHPRIVVAFVCLLALLSGCTGSITVLTPMSKKLGGLDRLCVELRSDDPDLQGAVEMGASKLIPELKDESWFGEVAPCNEMADAPLKLILTIEKYDRGEVTVFSRREAEIILLAELKDDADAKIGSFRVTSNSKSSGGVSVGGASTSAAHNLPARAWRAAADEIADHLDLSK